MGQSKQTRHLELHRFGNQFFIQINSIVGRLSLFADHPNYKIDSALNFKNYRHQTSGHLSLVSTKKKDLYILEDTDDRGNKTQNFIYVAEELSQFFLKHDYSDWIKKHLVDFFTRSISVAYLLVYLVYFFTIMRYYNTTNTLYVLRYITGVITLVFALAYYYLRSSRTKSSFLKFCFKTELFIFIVAGTINNVHHLIYLNSATDTF